MTLHLTLYHRPSLLFPRYLTFMAELQTKRIVIVSPSPPGSPQSGTIGQLQCSSEHNAKSFHCFFDPNTCSCYITGSDSMACQCKQIKLDAYYLLPDKVLPLHLAGVSIHPLGNTVGSELRSSSLVQLEVAFRNMTAALNTFEADCNITTSKFVGCYSCFSGAVGNISCSTNFETIFVDMECGTQSHSIKCDPKGTITTVRLHSSEPYLEQICAVNCPKNIRKIKIEGILKSVEERAIYALERINGTYTAIIKDSFWDALGKAIPPFSLFGWLDIFSI